MHFYRDHIGLVVENPEKNELFLLEANMGGVTLRPLSERIMRTKAQVIAVRKLIKLDSEAEYAKLKETLWHSASERVHKMYNTSSMDLLKSTLASYGAHTMKSASLRKRINHLNRLIIDIRNESCDYFNFPSNSLMRILLLRREQELSSSLEGAIAALQAKHDLDLAVAVNEKTLPKYFCSQLVAEILVQSEVLSEQRHNHSFIPADFSSSTLLETLPMGSYSFSPNLTLASKVGYTARRSGASVVIAPSSKTSSAAASMDAKERVLSFQFRSGDIFPPSITSPLIDEKGAVIDVRGNVEVLVPMPPTHGTGN